MKKLSMMFLIAFLGQISVLAQSEDKRIEISIGYIVSKVKTEQFSDFNSFAGIPAAQIPNNFQATQTQLENGFNGAFGTTKYLSGVNASGSFYFNKSFAVVADFGFTDGKQKRTVTNNPIFFEDVSQARRTRYTFLGGVQWKHRKHKVEPFLRAMAGVLRSQNRISMSISDPGNTSSSVESFRLHNNYTAFAVSIGGGIDIKVSKRFALRILQFDYIPTFSGSTKARLTAPPPGQADLGLTTLNNNSLQEFRIGAGIVFR